MEPVAETIYESPILGVWSNMLSCKVASFEPVAEIAPIIFRVPGATPPIREPVGSKIVLLVVFDSIGTPPI